MDLYSRTGHRKENEGTTTHNNVDKSHKDKLEKAETKNTHYRITYI